MSHSEVSWLFGRHAVIAALENPKRSARKLLLSKRLRDHEALRQTYQHIKIETVDPEVFYKKFGDETVHQGIALETFPLPDVHLEDILNHHADQETSLLVILDQVTDPHNVGAITRSAAAFAAHALLLPSYHSANRDSPTIAKTACGGLEHVPLVAINNLARAVKTLQGAGYWCIGLDERGEQSIDQVDLKGKICLILGAEGSGLRRLTQESCDVLCQLPTAPHFPTLNVSNAAAISFYEYYRQNLAAAS
jgi:rRNA methylase, putative, group 3